MGIILLWTPFKLVIMMLHFCLTKRIGLVFSCLCLRWMR